MDFEDSDAAPREGQPYRIINIWYGSPRNRELNLIAPIFSKADDCFPAFPMAS